MASKRKQRGMTLIEVIIAVVIVGILAGLGFPAYERMQRKNKRTLAKVGLEKTMQVQEQRRTRYGGYTIDLADMPQLTAELEAAAKYYTLSMVCDPAPPEGETACDGGATLTLTATAVNGQLNDDCATFTMSSTGIKDFTAKAGMDPTGLKCW